MKRFLIAITLMITTIMAANRMLIVQSEQSDYVTLSAHVHRTRSAIHHERHIAHRHARRDSQKVSGPPPATPAETERQCELLGLQYNEDVQGCAFHNLETSPKSEAPPESDPPVALFIMAIQA